MRCLKVPCKELPPSFLRSAALRFVQPGPANPLAPS